MRESAAILKYLDDAQLFWCMDAGGDALDRASAVAESAAEDFCADPALEYIVYTLWVPMTAGDVKISALDVVDMLNERLYDGDEYASDLGAPCLIPTEAETAQFQAALDVLKAAALDCTDAAWVERADVQLYIIADTTTAVTGTVDVELWACPADSTAMDCYSDLASVKDVLRRCKVVPEEVDHD